MAAARSAVPSSGAPHAAALFLAMLLCLLAGALAHAEPTFPALTGRIVDEAHLLTPEARAAIEAQLADLEQKSTDQLAVVTVKSLQDYPIEDYGYQLGRKWGIGQKGKDNGVLLIVAPNERKVRIEVGRGLEPTLTDAMSKLIIENAIIPQFRRGDFSAGVQAGVRDIKDVLLGDAEEVKQRARHASQELDFWQIVLILFWIAVILFVVFAIAQSISQQQRQAMAGRGQQRRRTGPVFVPVDYGGWSGGGWDGGGGGGGWSGGGGDFGGGGSSGSW